MRFDAFDSFADTTLEFPLGDKTYVVPIPDFETGARITRLVAGDDPESKTKPDAWLWELLLGPAHAEMVKDRVPDAFLKRAGQTALQHHLAGHDAAVKMWREGPDPLVLRAVLEAAMQEPAASKPSPSTGGANRTQRRASSKATTSPQS